VNLKVSTLTVKFKSTQDEKQAMKVVRSGDDCSEISRRGVYPDRESHRLPYENGPLVDHGRRLLYYRKGEKEKKTLPARRRGSLFPLRRSCRLETGKRTKKLTILQKTASRTRETKEVINETHLQQRERRKRWRKPRKL